MLKFHLCRIWMVHLLKSQNQRALRNTIITSQVATCNSSNRSTSRQFLTNSKCKWRMEVRIVLVWTRLFRRKVSTRELMQISYYSKSGPWHRFTAVDVCMATPMTMSRLRRRRVRRLMEDRYSENHQQISIQAYRWGKSLLKVSQLTVNRLKARSSRKGRLALASHQL
jgi:hypothetical protein